MAASPRYESPTCSSAMGERRATVRDLAKMFTALSMGEIAPSDLNSSASKNRLSQNEAEEETRSQTEAVES